MEKKLVLELKELPQRAERLDPNQIQEVFGGCVKEGGFCFTDKDCCDHSNPKFYKLCLSTIIGGKCNFFD